MTLKAYRSPDIPSGEIPHGFFTRHGGVSAGFYQSLNCGPGSDDKKAAVVENRRRASRHLAGGEGPLATLHQIHSAKVVVAAQPFPLDNLPKADALVSTTKGLVIGVLTADCAPILFADAKAGVIAAAHAGWRGLLTGILENTIGAMETLGADRKNITAVIGPCIAQASYQVGRDFYHSFISADPGYGDFFSPGKKDRRFFDLEGFVKMRLQAAGLEGVGVLSHDTYRDDREFFSYRRTCHKKEADYGRQLSAICLSGTG
ncbi:MAG: peptidoglycan editing factor PgeF [Proteobacteria bacterium]|nr:peptidoglycan editing factor PgeF [Pseudomonadota bacterium]